MTPDMINSIVKTSSTVALTATTLYLIRRNRHLTACLARRKRYEKVLEETLRKLVVKVPSEDAKTILEQMQVDVEFMILTDQ